VSTGVICDTVELVFFYEMRAAGEMSVPEAQLRKLASRLFAIPEPRIFYLFIPKCGCTYVKNVLWHIRTGKPHVNPLRVHDSDAFILRAGELVGDHLSIRSEDMAFSVVRNPVDRLLSLYLDKVVGTGRLNFVPLAETLIREGRIIENPSSLSDHHFNLLSLVDWLHENLTGNTGLPKNAHWTPQSDRSLVLRTFDLKILVVEHLTIGLNVLLRDSVPGIDHFLHTAERNRSTRTLPKSDLLTGLIRRRINELYSSDRLIHRRAVELWNETSHNEMASSLIPRFSQIDYARF
jgi:hypothetical protein